MADKLARQPQNVLGPWYVDMSCALCRICLEEAPNLLKYTKDETAVYFLKQPETSEEMDATNAPWTFAQLWQSEMTDEICDADESPLQELL
jgi:ferredoxin